MITIKSELQIDSSLLLLHTFIIVIIVIFAIIITHRIAGRIPSLKSFAAWDKYFSFILTLNN